MDSLKRPRERLLFDDDTPFGKKVNTINSGPGPVPNTIEFQSEENIDQDQVQQQQDLDQEPNFPDELDEDAIMAMIEENANNVQKKNQEDRVRFANQPEKFAESELDLNEQLDKFKDLAAAESELFDEFIKLKGPQILISLLSHANTDIIIATLGVLASITEPDNFEEDLETEDDDDDDTDTTNNKKSDDKVNDKSSRKESRKSRFVTALIDSNLTEMVIDGFLRIDESISDEDAKGVSDALNILENITELQPGSLKPFIETKKFLHWLLKRIRFEQNDENRTYASEILFIMVQTIDSTDLEKAFKAAGVDVIDKLLKSVAIYRKRDPVDSLEKEFSENIFNSLCQLLLQENHQKQFATNQGIELMVRILNQGNYSSKLALRVSEMACRNSRENCNSFIERLGLRPLFAFFMSQGLKKKELQSAEEYILSLIQSLARHSSGNNVARLMHKFVENQFEKLQRLFELHANIRDRLLSAESSERLAAQASVAEDVALDEADLYLQRLEDGLSALQQTDLIILRLCNTGNKQLLDAVKSLFSIKGIPKRELVGVIEEYMDRLDDEKGFKERMELERYMKVMILT